MEHSADRRLCGNPDQPVVARTTVCDRGVARRPALPGDGFPCPGIGDLNIGSTSLAAGRKQEQGRSQYRFHGGYVGDEPGSA